MKNILNDLEIKVLKAFYEKSDHNNPLSLEEISQYLGYKEENPRDVIDFINILANSENKYLNTKLGGINGPNKYYISVKGKLLLYEIEKNEKSLKQSRRAIYCSVGAIVISILALGISTYFNYKDYSGDLDWQNQQLNQLQEINKSIQDHLIPVETGIQNPNN